MTSCDECDYVERGCPKKIPILGLKSHVRECEFRPIVCTNEKCGQTFNQKDVANHVSKTCEYRLVHCLECDGEMIYKKFAKHPCELSKDLNRLELEWSEVKDILTEMCYSQNEMCDLQKEILSSIETLADDKENNAGGPQTPIPNLGCNIMIIGGRNSESNFSSVEVLSPDSKKWELSQPMLESRGSASSALHGNEVYVAGGRSNGSVSDTIERLSLVSKPLKWTTFSVKLPLKCSGHKVAVINNCLYSVGGHGFNTIHSILLHAPYTTRLKCELQQAVCFHGLQAVGESLYIFGGSPTGTLEKAVNTVLSYNVATNEVSTLKSLPFAICDVATVRWKNSVIIIGGTANNGMSLNTVILYNTKGNTQKMLPSMKHARSSCTATVAGNKVVVMGGYDWCGNKYLNSAECFDLDRQVWEELPAMNKARSEASAVAYLGLV